MRTPHWEDLDLAETIEFFSTLPRLDREQLARQTFGDKAFELEILGLFLVESRRQIANLGAAADAKAWKLSAHTLKGSGRTIGAQRFAEICEHAEQQSFPATLAIRRALIAAIEAEFAALSREITAIT